jgi:hypothetical protein
LIMVTLFLHEKSRITLVLMLPLHVPTLMDNIPMRDYGDSNNI